VDGAGEQHADELSQAMFELIATEGDYVRDLQLIVEVSLSPKRHVYFTLNLSIRSPQVFYASMMQILDEKSLETIFSNIEDVSPECFRLRCLDLSPSPSRSCYSILYVK
jgi:hypothetical protein